MRLAKLLPLAVPWLLACQAAFAVPAEPAASAPSRPAMRSPAEPTDTDDPAWPLVQRWIAGAPDVEVLTVDQEAGGAALAKLQITPRSPLGAVVDHSGGLLVDHGWLRILGAGGPRMKRSLPGWNEGRVAIAADGRPPFVLVADDVLGGFFAINAGALGQDTGKMYYLAPDTLQWERLDLGYAEFLAWALSPRLADFYRGQRWPGWQEEVAKLDGDQALSVYPPLWAEGPAVGKRTRKTIPVEESFRQMMEFRLRVSR